MTASERVLLADGAPVEIRGLEERDAGTLERLHRRLPARDHWLRFVTLSDRGLARYCADAAAAGRVWGAFAGAELLGAVHLATASPVAGGADAAVDAEHAGDAAEIAVTVAHRMQAHGVGTALLERAVRESRRLGVTRWSAEVLAENTAMLRVFADLGLASRRTRTGSTVHLDITLPDPGDGAYDAAATTRLARSSRAGLEPVLQPRSVAVVGAGRRGSVGRAVLDALVTGGYRGRLHTVHPRAAAVGAVPVVPRVAALPEAPDLAVLATPAATLPELVEDCGRRGVRALLVLTAGLAEAGVAAAVRDGVRRWGMRMVGPNCLGVADTGSGLDATFARGPVPAGHVGVVAQSGGVAIAVLEGLRATGLGVSSLVAIGDRYDVSSNDLLAWWDGDGRTRVAVLHLESFGNPRTFTALARRLAARIPVLAVRTASSAEGARAAASHTAASATPSTRRDALYRQARVQPVDDLGELIGAVAALSWCPPARGDRVAIVGNAGGTNVLAADACVAAGLRLPAPAAATRARLADLLPPTAALANPVDTTATVDAPTMAGCVRALSEDAGVDAVLVLVCPTALGDPGTGLPATIVDAHRQGIPVVRVALDQRARVASTDDTHGTPVTAGFADPADGVRALAHLVRRGADLAAAPGRPLREGHPIDRRAAAAVVAGALDRSPGGCWLDVAQAAALLRAAGVDTVVTRTVADAEGAVAAARSLGGPVALKVVADGVLHKTEQGGVALGLEGDDAVRRAAEAFASRFAALRGIVVQPMAPPGIEMLVGIAGDPDFGALVTVGVGGVATDLADRRAHRLVPLSTTDLDALLDELPLDRGAAAAMVDRERLGDVVARVAQLAEHLPQIAEMDLNPVVCSPGACRVLDVRVRVAPAEGGD